jgi:DNA-binding NtrC family response regulator
MNKKVLIIDDEKNIRIALTKCLKGEGYIVDSVEDGIEGLDKLSSAKYDLVLLDINLPELSGLKVLEKIREKGITSNVIIMTAYGTIEKAVEAMKLGALDFISKPFNPEQIRDIVRVVIDRQDLNENNINSLRDYIEYSKKCLISGRYIEGEEMLKKSLSISANDAEVYNLLGILSEYKEDLHQAQGYYRAALAMDASYRPAIKNLERTSQFIYQKAGMEIEE